MKSEHRGKEQPPEKWKFLDEKWPARGAGDANVTSVSLGWLPSFYLQVPSPFSPVKNAKARQGLLSVLIDHG